MPNTKRKLNNQHPCICLTRCNAELAVFNKFGHPSSRIQHEFPSRPATSHRDFALTVNRSRAVTKRLLNYAEATREDIDEIKQTICSPIEPKSESLNRPSLCGCGCCLNVLGVYTRVLIHGMQAWMCCVMAWMILSSALLTVKLYYLPVDCNTTVANSSNQT